MNTRTAKDNSVMHQSRYASSPEFERGLLANLVAKRCSILDDKTDRELIWFVQYLSHQEGGMAAMARDLISKFPTRLGSPAMVKIGRVNSQNYNAQQVREIRLELPFECRRRFPLRGETKSDLSKFSMQARRLAGSSERARALRAWADNAICEDGVLDDVITRQNESDLERAGKHPISYPAEMFFELCRQMAAQGSDYENAGHNLEKELCEFCLNPEWDFAAGGPWYFSDLLNVLREYHQQWIEDKSGVVVTTLGEKVCGVLDYTLFSRSLSLMEGNARLGKSFAAKSWCRQHPGQARFVEVPTGNDDASFFRDMARGLGLGNFLNYKVVQIRERVESVLLTGNILLVLDEAQRLWPQKNLREGFPGRISWVMAMANAGVPICMISTPQFIQSQKTAEKHGWNSAQLTGRIGHYEILPAELETSDLMAVSRSVLPEASDTVLQALADYASMSARYLAAVDSIAKRARYLAQRAGRATCNTEDVRTAMKESVIPSDTMLIRTLEHAKKSSPRERVVSPPNLPAQVEPPARSTKPAAEADITPRFSRRNSDFELVKT